MSDLVSGYWLTFAKTGNPNGGSRPAWPEQTADTDVLLDFQAEGVTAKEDFEAERMRFMEHRYSDGLM